MAVRRPAFGNLVSARGSRTPRPVRGSSRFRDRSLAPSSNFEMSARQGPWARTMVLVKGPWPVRGRSVAGKPIALNPLGPWAARGLPRSALRGRARQLVAVRGGPWRLVATRGNPSIHERLWRPTACISVRQVCCVLAEVQRSRGASKSVSRVGWGVCPTPPFFSLCRLAQPIDVGHIVCDRATETETEN